jgi:hypothetical protein
MNRFEEQQVALMGRRSHANIFAGCRSRPIVNADAHCRRNRHCRHKNRYPTHRTCVTGQVSEIDGDQP